MVLSDFSGLCIERNLKSGKGSSIRKIETFMAVLRSLCSRASKSGFTRESPGPSA
jgi:hypothetical protein